MPIRRFMASNGVRALPNGSPKNEKSAAPLKLEVKRGSSQRSSERLWSQFPSGRLPLRAFRDRCV